MNLILFLTSIWSYVYTWYKTHTACTDRDKLRHYSKTFPMFYLRFDFNQYLWKQYAEKLKNCICCPFNSCIAMFNIDYRSFDHQYMLYVDFVFRLMCCSLCSYITTCMSIVRSVFLLLYLVSSTYYIWTWANKHNYID